MTIARSNAKSSDRSMQAFVSGLELAPSTVGLVFQHLNSLLEAAAEDGLIARNPARGVKVPASIDGEVVPPTVAQVEALYEAAAEWFRPAVVLGAGLGLRQAEASGLTADRVLWLARAVRVDRQWNSRVTAAVFVPPKTRSSDRTVPASRYVIDYLADHVGRRHEAFVLHRGGEPVDWQAFGPPVAAGQQARRTREDPLPRPTPRVRVDADQRRLLGEGGQRGARPLVGGHDSELVLAPVAG